MKKTKITEAEFKRIIAGKDLTPNEENILRKNCGLPYNEENLPKLMKLRKRLLMKAKLKLIRNIKNVMM